MTRALNVTRFSRPIRFAEGLARQRAIMEELARRDRPVAELLLLEHEPVYTLGRATSPEHLLGDPESLAARSGVEVVNVDRGGSVTYHGPGQLTGYLLLNLKRFGNTIHQHLWNLEEAVIRAAAKFGIDCRRVEGMTGVWASPSHAVQAGREADLPAGPSPRDVATEMAKLCAIGVGCRRWVTYHGLGMNVDLDLSPFRMIDPCGLGRKPVTCLARLLGRTVARDEVESALVDAVVGLLKAKARWPRG